MSSPSDQPDTSLADALARSLGRALSERRDALGLTQPDVAERVGLSYQQIQKYEYGTSKMKLVQLVQFAVALETSPKQLLEDATTMAAEPISEYHRAATISNADRAAAKRLREERRLVAVFRDLTNAGHRRTVLELAQSLRRSEQERDQ